MELKEIMAQYHNIELSDKQCELIMADLSLIIEHNKIHNLTRIESPEAGLVRHLEDSLIGLPFIMKAPEGRYADIGTGGGFPGIPLAIMTGRETLLVDSVQKKMRCLDEVCVDLGIADYVSTYAGRIEQLAVDQGKSFAVITARALSNMSSLLELASPLLKMGGQLICYKARPEQEEIDNALALEKKLGMKLVSRETTVLSDGSERCFFVFEKIAKPKVTLPRRVGLAQKNPFVAIK